MGSSRQFLTIVALITAAGFGILGAEFLRKSACSGAFSSVPEVEAKAWFNVPGSLRKEDLEGRPILLEYWATWCAPCLSSIPKLNELQHEFADQGLLIIGVAEEPADLIGSYVRRYGICYPVCAELSGGTEAIPFYPYAVLVSPEGQIVWQGDGRYIDAPLRNLMQTVPDKAYPSVLSQGHVVGGAPVRPEFAQNYDRASLRMKLDRLLKMHKSSDLSQLHEVFGFYWKNLPRGSWPGDEEVRYAANSALFESYLGNRDKSSKVILEEIQREALKRLRAKDPSWTKRSRIARHVGYFFERGNLQAIQRLQQALGAESNPLVRLAVEQTLEKLDPTRLTPTQPKSQLRDAKERYERLSGTLKVKFLGLPADLARYQRYQASLDELFSKSENHVDIVHQLLKDYRHQDQGRPSDLLIRHTILDAAGSWAHKKAVSGEPRALLQEGIFQILRQPENDWKLREQAIRTLESVGFESLDPSKLLERIASMLSQEKVRDVKALLDFLRLKIVDPHKLK